MLTLQSSHVVVDCPICGRPLEISPQFISREIACGHCQGKFTVHETEEGTLATSNWRGTDPLKRAEQLLLATSDTDLSDSDCFCQERFPRISVQDDEPSSEASLDTLPKEAESKPTSKPTVLLVEHRDEVFARIATDLAEFGMRVVRAKSETEALKLFDKDKPTLVVANTDLPGQSGWLLTAKLRLLDRDTRVWLYHRWPSNYGHDIARFLNVEVQAYQGDLLSLSEMIVDRMANRDESRDGANDSDRPEKSTVA